MSDEPNEPDFKTLIKRRKAVEWLMMNDVLIRTAAKISERCPVSAILLGAQYGAVFESKIMNVLPSMEVTPGDIRGEAARLIEAFKASAELKTVPPR